MTTRIYKYPLDEPSVKLPDGFKFLTLALDPDGVPCIWCEVEPVHANITTYQIKSIWTGKSPPENSRYLGTYIDHLLLVNHVYLILPSLQ